MKEIRTIIEGYNNIDFATTKAALVTVVGLKGSSYRRRGARMLVLDNGIYLGGISGGCLEGDALKRAQIAILKDRPSIVTYDTTKGDDVQIGIGLGCNGIIDILFTPLKANDNNNPVKILSSIINTRTPQLLTTITGGTSSLLGNNFLYDGAADLENVLANKSLSSLSSQISNDINICFDTLTSSTITYAKEDLEITLFLEIILPETNLVVYGNNNDITSIAKIAKELGWKVTIVCNLIKASKLMYQTADKLLEMKDHSLSFVDDHTAVVLMTHDFQTDKIHLPQILKTSASYIGLLGPKTRAERLFNELEISMEDRVFAPTGLDIGATTPEEIALSIIAEIKSKFAKREAGYLKNRNTPINEN